MEDLKQVGIPIIKCVFWDEEKYQKYARFRLELVSSDLKEPKTVVGVVPERLFSSPVLFRMLSSKKEEEKPSTNENVWQSGRVSVVSLFSARFCLAWLMRTDLDAEVCVLETTSEIEQVLEMARRWAIPETAFGQNVFCRYNISFPAVPRVNLFAVQTRVPGIERHIESICSMEQAKLRLIDQTHPFLSRFLSFQAKLVIEVLMKTPQRFANDLLALLVSVRQDDGTRMRWIEALRQANPDIYFSGALCLKILLRSSQLFPLHEWKEKTAVSQLSRSLEFEYCHEQALDLLKIGHKTEILVPLVFGLVLIMVTRDGNRWSFALSVSNEKSYNQPHMKRIKNSSYFDPNNEHQEKPIIISTEEPLFPNNLGDHIIPDGRLRIVFLLSSFFDM